MLTNDSLQISAIREWFGALWEESREITDSDLAEARLKWEQRRAARPKHSPSSSYGFSLGSLCRSDLTDRRVFVAIYRGWISDEAKKAYRTYEEQLTSQQIPKSFKLPPIYENWPELPKEAQLLDVYYGPRGALHCDGVFTRTHDIKFKFNDSSKGHLSVCRKDDHVMGHPFGAKEKSKFIKNLRPCIEKIWKSNSAIGDESGKYIHLADVIDICG